MITISQLIHRARIFRGGGVLQEFGRFRFVLTHSFAEEITFGEESLRAHIPVLPRELEPMDRLHKIARHTPAIRVAQTNFGHRVRASMCRGRAQPVIGSFRVALAQEIAQHFHRAHHIELRCLGDRIAHPREIFIT